MSGTQPRRSGLQIKVAGAASWLALVFLLVQALRQDGTPAGTMLAIGPMALLATYALTSAWVWHNKHIYRAKGARRRRPYLPYPWTRDRLGREYAGTIAPACGRGEVVLSLVGNVKTYR